jgi:hypothetical protein
LSNLSVTLAQRLVKVEPKPVSGQPIQISGFAPHLWLTAKEREQASRIRQSKRIVHFRPISFLGLEKCSSCIFDLSDFARQIADVAQTMGADGGVRSLETRGLVKLKCARPISGLPRLVGHGYLNAGVRHCAKLRKDLDILIAAARLLRH